MWIFRAVFNHINEMIEFLFDASLHHIRSPTEAIVAQEAESGTPLFIPQLAIGKEYACSESDLGVGPKDF